MQRKETQKKSDLFHQKRPTRGHNDGLNPLNTLILDAALAQNLKQKGTRT
jgi:hypothetical protein